MLLKVSDSDCNCMRTPCEQLHTFHSIALEHRYSYLYLRYSYLYLVTGKVPFSSRKVHLCVCVSTLAGKNGSSPPQAS